MVEQVRLRGQCGRQNIFWRYYEELEGILEVELTYLT
jgi:hypothetical protein